MRFLDFQEITLMTLDQGKVAHARFGKVSFLDKEKDFLKRGIKRIRWDVLREKIEIVIEKHSNVDDRFAEELPAKTVENINIPHENMEINFTQVIKQKTIPAQHICEHSFETGESITKTEDRKVVKNLAALLYDDDEEDGDLMEELKKMNMAGRG